MSRGKVVIKNSFFAGIQQVISLSIGLITTKMIINSYGPELFGLTSSVSQVFGYFLFLQWGLMSTIIFALQRAYVKENDKIDLINSYANSQFKKLAAIVILCSIVISLYYSIFVKSEFYDKIDMFLLVFIISGTTIIEFGWLGKYYSYINSMQKNYILSIINLMYILLQTIIIILSIYFGFSLLLLKFLVVLSTFFKLLMLKLYIKRYLPIIDFRTDSKGIVLHQKNDAIIMKGFEAINAVIPVFLMTYFLSLSELSIHGVYSLVFVGILAMVSIFSNGMQATFGDIDNKETKITLIRAFRSYEFTFIFIATILFSVTSSMLESFTKLYIGSVNVEFPQFLALFYTLNFFFSIGNNPSLSLLNAKGYYNLGRNILAFQITINLLIGTILGYFFGYNGILIGYTLSSFSGLILTNYFIIFKIQKKLFLDSLLRIGLGVFFIVTSYLFSALLGSNFTNFSSWMLFGVVISIAIVGLFGIINYIMFKTDFLEVINRIFTIFK